VTLLADPRYAYTFSFIDCREVVLSGLSAGHTEAGDCDGGVLSFVGCTGVLIDGCDLFGSGTIGVAVTDSSGITVRASTIRDCTYGALSALAVQELRLERVVMMRDGAYPVVSLEGSPGVVMDSCRLEDNEGSQLFWLGQDSSLALPGSRITRNTVEVIYDEDSGVPELSGAIVENNSLGMADTGEIYDEGYEEYQEGYPGDEEVGDNGDPME
jgi:hypothetical protein